MKTTILALIISFSALNADAICTLDQPIELPSLENGPVVAESFETQTPGESEDLTLVFDYVKGGKGTKINSKTISVRIDNYSRYAGPLSEYPSDVKIESEIERLGVGYIRHSVFAVEAWWHAESSNLIFRNGKLVTASIMTISQDNKDICIKSITF